MIRLYFSLQVLFLKTYCLAFVVVVVVYLALAAPRFLGCYQDSESRDLPTEVPVKPLTVEGCVSKCGETGFSIAGLQSSTQCFCGSTYSKYGRLNDKQCSMRCTGNYQEICGGVMMNSLYYTGKITSFFNHPLTLL